MTCIGASWPNTGVIWRLMARERFFQSKKYVIVTLRFLLLVSLLVIVWFQDLQRLPAWGIAITMVVLAGSNIWLLAMPSKRFQSQLLYGAVFVVDLAVVTLLMIAMAGNKIEFYAVFVPYIVTIIYAAVTRKVSAAFLIVFQAAIVYGLLVVVEGKGSALLSTPFLSWIVLFFLTAFFVGYLSDEIQRELAVRKRLEISEKTAHEATDALGRLLSLHELIIESIPVGLVVADKDLLVMYANTRFAEMLGAPRRGIEGGQVGSFHCERARQQSHLRELLEEAFEKKTQNVSTEFVCENPSGGQETFLCSVHPIVREGEVPRMVMALIEDVTVKKKAQEGRLEATRIESQLRILSSLSGAMSSLDSLRQIVSKFASATEPVLSFTACATLELDKEPRVLSIYLTSPVGKGFVDRLRERVLESLTQVVPEFSADAPLEVEFDKELVSEADGSEMESFLAVPVVVSNETLALIGFASTDIDAFKPQDISFVYTLANYYSLILSRARIEEEMFRREVEDQLQRERFELETARKQVEIEMTRKKLEAERDAVKELKRIDELKNEFISTVSHEMRTPMTSIKSSMDLLLSGRLGDVSKEHKAFLEIAVRNIDRLAQLIDDVLNVSRIESGRQKLSPGIYEIAPIVENILATLKTKLGEKEAQVANEIPPRLNAFFDRNGLTQVLTNLIANAANHNAPGVQIRLSVVSSDKDFVTLSVADNGIGIPESEHEKVFERFYQSGRTYGEGSKGTGLGLTISRGLVEAMGGEIHLESQEGQGADFRFTLPPRPGTATHARQQAHLESAYSEPSPETLFGKIAVLNGFVTTQQVNECAREQASGKAGVKLGELLVSKGYMKAKERDAVIKLQEEVLAGPSPHDPDKTLSETIIGSLALKRGMLTERQLNECLREQAVLESEGKRCLLGELFVRKELLSVEQILNLLSEQKGAPAAVEPHARDSDAALPRTGDSQSKAEDG